MRQLRILLPPALFVFFSAIAVHSATPQAPPAPTVNVPMAERPTLAIVALDDGSIKRESWWGTNWDVGSGLSDILTTILLEKNRFRLLERSLLDKALAEQDLSASARVDSKTAVKIGKVIGADYLVMGKVTQFSWEKKGGGGVVPIGGIFGLGLSKTKAIVSVDIRIVDAESAEILGSYSGKADESRSKVAIGGSGFGVIAMGSSDFLGTALGQATRKALVQWTDNLCDALDKKKLTLTPKHTAPTRPDGVALTGDASAVIANTGSDKGYAVGDVVEIHRKTKELKDPETGEVLRVMTDLIATGTIVKIDRKTCDIKISSCESGKIPTDGDIVRIKTPAPPASPPAASTAPTSNGK